MRASVTAITLGDAIVEMFVVEFEVVGDFCQVEEAGVEKGGPETGEEVFAGAGRCLARGELSEGNAWY